MVLGDLCQHCMKLWPAPHDVQESPGKSMPIFSAERRGISTNELRTSSDTGRVRGLSSSRVAISLYGQQGDQGLDSRTDFEAATEAQTGSGLAIL